ncbi:MAG TPA: stage V sporulation protein AC [Syntrophothermus lipocalidus]|nr:stage V sporulation protein AC [Syntrophothermus lipocalidus]
MVDQSEQAKVQKIDALEYDEMVKQIKPKPPVLKNSVWAFVVGGLICTVGQGLLELFKATGLDAREAGAATSVVLIGIGAILTGLGVYDELGKRAGAGSIVPITGFANSIVAAAMEFKREGYVLGVGARMFQVAGPVLVYGITTGVLIGLVAYLFK